MDAELFVYYTSINLIEILKKKKKKLDHQYWKPRIPFKLGPIRPLGNKTEDDLLNDSRFLYTERDKESCHREPAALCDDLEG